MVTAVVFALACFLPLISGAISDWRLWREDSSLFSRGDMLGETLAAFVILGFISWMLERLYSLSLSQACQDSLVYAQYYEMTKKLQALLK